MFYFISIYEIDLLKGTFLGLVCALIAGGVAAEIREGFYILKKKHHKK
jgi:hypothetical protein